MLIKLQRGVIISRLLMITPRCSDIVKAMICNAWKERLSAMQTVSESNVYLKILKRLQ